MSALPSPCEPVWRSALVGRERAKVHARSCGARARLVLAELLRRAGYDVSLVTIHGWSRAAQGSAYLWAFAFLHGREDVPAPPYVVEAGGAP